MKRRTRVLAAARRFLTFFLLMCFIVTCCMLLFLNTLQAATGWEFREAELQPAARITFGNVVLLSLLCAVIDAVRRRVMVERPVGRIIRAFERVMAGDLTARVAPVRGLDAQDGLHTVIACFNRMAEELSGMELLRSDFIANVSHELKTPLAVLQSHAAMLQRPDLPAAEQQACAAAIAAAAGDLAGMVSNILRLNQLENQHIYPDVRTYDLGEQLCECLLAFEAVWEEKGLEIETALAEDVQVRADPALWALVWNNLFSNAMKFTPPGGRVSLTLEAAGETAVVRVVDTGCGIRPEDGRRIFEKFYQGDASRATQGNGLGLALVKRVLDITGGTVAVESGAGKGSVFTVTLERRLKHAD
ncbi:MAG: HAMP domain-containing histidine kinase [Oscillospiraceae bacterium]|nr:HAMP domain-containing histidine kinase [Oscillospiraceae bacterium]